MAKTFASGNDVETYIIVNHFNRNIKESYLGRIISGKTQHRLTLQSTCGLAEIHISPGSLFVTFRLVKFGNPSSFLCDTGRQQSHERVWGHQAGCRNGARTAALLLGCFQPRPAGPWRGANLGSHPEHWTGRRTRVSLRRRWAMSGLTVSTEGRLSQTGPAPAVNRKLPPAAGSLLFSPGLRRSCSRTQNSR